MKGKNKLEDYSPTNNFIVMIYTHTIGRIGKDCKTITGAHGTFIVVDMAVDDYSKGQNITTWVRVRSSRENHIRLAEYLTKGRLILQLRRNGKVKFQTT